MFLTVMLRPKLGFSISASTKSKKSPEPRSFLDQGERNAYELETLHKATRKFKRTRKAKDYIA